MGTEEEMDGKIMRERKNGNGMWVALIGRRKFDVRILGDKEIMLDKYLVAEEEDNVE